MLASCLIGDAEVGACFDQNRSGFDVAGSARIHQSGKTTLEKQEEKRQSCEQ